MKKRSSYVVGAVMGALVLVSLFAPTPWTRTVQADKDNACPGLAKAYAACQAGGGECSHIFEQLIAHGCAVPSGSSR